jgi:hypothetical protein
MTETPILTDRNPRTIGQWLPLVFVLLVAAALRLSGVGDFPVSTDEGWTTWAISEPTFGAVVDAVAADRHPPLYFIALAYWSRLAGDSHLALRFPALLVGVLTCALVYRVGADTFGRTARPGREDVAWYGMLMFALLPSAVYYAQEIRHYGWFVGAVTGSSFLFLRVLRTPRPRILFFYALSVALMGYILYFAVWVALLHALFALVLWRGDVAANWRTSNADRLKVAAAWLVAFVLYIPWLYVIATQQWAILTTGITAAPGSFTSRLPDVLALLELLMGGGLALTAGLYVVGFWGSLVSDRTEVTLGLRMANPAWLGELFIVAWGFGLFVLLVFVNNFTGVLSARTMLFTAPAWMIVVGAGIVRLRIGVRWSLLAGFVGVSLFLPPLIQPRLDYTLTADALAGVVQDGDLIVLETVWDDNAFRYEIGQAIGTTDAVIRTQPYVNNRDPYQPVVPQVSDALAAANRVWVVQWNSFPEVLPHLQSDDAFTPLTTLEAYVGAQYAGRFRDVGADDYVQIVGFVRTDAVNADFDDVLALDGVWLDVNNDALIVDSVWTAPTTPDRDYSIGVTLLDGETVVTSYDTGLAAFPTVSRVRDGVDAVPPVYTSAWEPNTTYPARVTVPLDGVPNGEYSVLVRVYDYQTPDAPLTVGDADAVAVGTVAVAR